MRDPDREQPPFFTRGDRVRCGTDGPVMHVVDVSPGHCVCHWVDAFGRLHGGTFDQRVLVHVPVPPRMHPD